MYDSAVRPQSYTVRPFLMTEMAKLVVPRSIPTTNDAVFAIVFPLFLWHGHKLMYAFSVVSQSRRENPPNQCYIVYINRVESNRVQMKLFVTKRCHTLQRLIKPHLRNTGILNRLAFFDVDQFNSDTLGCDWLNVECLWHQTGFHYETLRLSIVKS